MDEEELDERMHEGLYERPNNGFPARGSIEVIVGSMFSGKTEELMRRLRRAVIARQRVQVFKPLIDTRYSQGDVVSHDRNTLEATAVARPETILLLSSDAQVVGIDEGQFFDTSLVDICLQMADSGIRVVVSGLDMDYERKPFGCMPRLMAVADREQVLVGAKAEYEPLCRNCYLKRLNRL